VQAPVSQAAEGLGGFIVKRWRVIENKWNKESKPWTGAVGIEEVDDDLAVPAIVCWFTRGWALTEDDNGEWLAQHVVDLHNLLVSKEAAFGAQGN
jgi:hypothetical protein